MGKYVDFYCGENNKELKKIVDPILKSRFGWIPQKDYDDFYSMAACVVWKCEEDFKESKSQNNKFKNFLVSCIHNKVKSQLTYMHRGKRVLKDDGGKPIYEVSIDAPITECDSSTLGDVLASDFDLQKEIFKNEEEYSEKMLRYLNKLSYIQKEILKLTIAGYHSDEIREILHISKKQYTDCNAAIHAYRNVSILF